MITESKLQCSAAASSAAVSGSAAFFRVVEPGLARVVPEAQDAAHGGVQLPSRLLIHLFAVEQQVDYPTVDLDGLAARRVVYRLDVVYALVIVIDIVELVVLPQRCSVTPAAVGGEGLLALRVADDGGQRVEEVEEGGLCTW